MFSLFVAQGKGVLEVQQRDHQARRQAWAPGIAGSTGTRRHRAKQIDLVSRCAGGFGLARKARGQGRFELRPRQALGQHGQRMMQIDHLIDAGAKKVAGAHRAGPKLPETAIHCN